MNKDLQVAKRTVQTEIQALKKLSQSLYEWTGKRWIISLSKEENLKTFQQEKIDKREEYLNKEKKGETFKEMLKIFPDADLTDVKTEDE